MVLSAYWRARSLLLQAAGPPVQLEPVDLSVKTPVVLQVPRYSPAAIINAAARRVPSPSTTPTPPPLPPPPLCASTGKHLDSITTKIYVEFPPAVYVHAYGWNLNRILRQWYAITVYCPWGYSSKECICTCSPTRSRLARRNSRSWLCHDCGFRNMCSWYIRFLHILLGKFEIGIITFYGLWLILWKFSAYAYQVCNKRDVIS